MLSERQREIVKATVPALRAHGETITRTFYGAMFSAHPELYNLFNPANQRDGGQARSLAASVLASVVQGAADGSIEGASALLSGLPVAGYDGTLFDRGDADPATAPGTVRAKTGTLLGVHALAGTAVTADGRLLAFAVVADGATGSETAAEGVLDDIAATLASCGCR